MADGQGIRTGAPSGFMTCIRARDQVTLAISVLHAIESLAPIEVPRVPPMSPELESLMSNGPKTLPEGTDTATVRLRAEHEGYCAKLLTRAGVKSENERRVRSTLWAEQCLRKHGHEEHEVLRAFNRDVWGVNESASRDIAEREAQVRTHA